MFEYIQGFFEQVAEFFSKVWDFVTFLIDEIVAFFKMIKPAMDFFINLLNSLPPVFKVFGIAMVTVLIIYIVLGRTAGGD